MNKATKSWKTTVDIEADSFKPLYFPEGMIGFANAQHYVVLTSGKGDIACFQSTERAEASFLLTPWDKERLRAEPTLQPEHHEILEYQAGDHLLWLIVLNPFTDPNWVLANLQAPVVINQRNHRGMQCIQVNSELSLHYHWMPQPKQAAQ